MICPENLHVPVTPDRKQRIFPVRPNEVSGFRLLSHPLSVCELLLVQPGFDELDQGEPGVCAVRQVRVVVDSQVVQNYPSFEDELQEMAVEVLVT